MPPVVTKRKREGIQLCKVYQPGKKTNPKVVFVEPKFDGIRGLIIVKDGEAKAVTSTGLKIWNVDHILDVFNENVDCRLVNDMVFDGEFLSPELGFDATSGLTRKFEPDPRAKTIKFYAWDILDLIDFEMKFSALELRPRKRALHQAVKAIGSPLIEEVQFTPANSHEEIEKICQTLVAKGYEGGVIKDINGRYEFKKSNAWLKWKPYKEGDFQIMGAIEGRGKHVGRLGAIQIAGFRQPDGNIVPRYDPVELRQRTIESEVGTGFDDAQRELYWGWHSVGALVGRTVEIKYQDISKDGALRFPVFYRMREDKDV